MPSTDADSAELCEGELYRDGRGIEVWRIKEIGTVKVLQEGIASDHHAARQLQPRRGVRRRTGGVAAMSCPFCTPADAGELREELADIYTRDMLMPSMYTRAVRIIRNSPAPLA
jgi:hypothetical protein